MDESEKYEAQGRAHAELKKARGVVADRERELLKYADCMKSATFQIGQLLTVPPPDEIMRPLWQKHIEEAAKCLPDSETLLHCMQDLEQNRRRVSALEQRIAEF